MRNSPRLEALLTEAEQNDVCCIPQNERDARLLERHAAAGEILRLAPSIYARQEWWAALDPLQRHVHLARALAERHPDWTFCGPTAAALQGLSPSFETLRTMHIVGRSSHAARQDTRAAMPLQRHELSSPDTETVNGIRMTSPSRTAFDCMRRLSFSNGLAIADATIRRLSWSAQDLMDYVKDIGRTGSSRGTAHALVTASYADGGAESGGESIARATIIRLGYELPLLQLGLTDPLDGSHSYRVDFAWPLNGGGLLAGELDGKKKYKDPEMTHGREVADIVYEEKMRESHISALGITVMRLSFSDVTQPQRLDDILTTYKVPRARDRMPNPSIRPDCLERRTRGTYRIQTILGYTMLVEKLECSRGLPLLSENDTLD